MDIRTAILRAADRFERGEREFNFCEAVATPGDGGQACYVGEIAYQLGRAANILCGSESDPGITPELLGITFKTFQERMKRLGEINGLYGWTCRGPQNAALLRLYADKYHPATERPIHYPNWHAIATAPLDEADAAETLLRAAIKERRTA